MAVRARYFRFSNCATLVLALLLAGTSYPASLVVNPASPAASDAGVGSDVAPFATIAAAMKKLQPGDRLTIAAGTYREPVLFPARTWDGSVETLIEGDATGKTWIKGSVVTTDWIPQGAGRFIRAMAWEPEQIFINGESLRQVGGTIFGGYPELASHPLAPLMNTYTGGIWPGRIALTRASMPVNSFHYDKARGDVMIRWRTDNLATSLVEVSALQRVLYAPGVARVTLRNLNFEHANTTATTRGGAVQLDGKNITLDRVAARRMDGTCLGLNGTDHQIIASTFSECGQTGMGGYGSGWKITSVTVSGNNTRGFNKNWEAGGAKFVGNGGLANSTLADFKATGNFGDGLWFDWNNHDNRITESVFAFNAGFGLHIEVSNRFTADHNVFVGNVQRGVYARQSSDSTFAFNLFAGNGEGLTIITEGPGTAALNNAVIGNVFAWNPIALTLPDPLATNTSDANAFIGDPATSPGRIGWNSTLSRTAWLAKGLDTGSEWIDIPKAQAPKFNATQPLDPQLLWYHTARRNMRSMSAAALQTLKLRAPAVTETRPGW